MKSGPQHAKLIDGKVVPCTLEQWLEWTAKNHNTTRIVARDETDTHLVSTVFLGLNHAQCGNVRGVWFETMIFAKTTEGRLDIYLERYSTFEEARVGHHMALAWLQEKLSKDG